VNKSPINANDNHPQSLVFNGFRAANYFLIALILPACASSLKQTTGTSGLAQKPDLICQSAASYKDLVVGDGHCVSLIKQCTGAPPTGNWRAGASVLNSSLPSGTIIATFNNNRYPNRTGYHAAIYIKHDQNGIWVWDQWVGKPVHKRLIRIRNDNDSAGNTAQAYKVVKIKN
jgi:hypothetical protein